MPTKTVSNKASKPATKGNKPAPKIVPTTPVHQVSNRKVFSSPVADIWRAVCDPKTRAKLGDSRSEIVKALMAKGAAKGTAATQYQRAFAAGFVLPEKFGGKPAKAAKANKPKPAPKPAAKPALQKAA